MQAESPLHIRYIHVEWMTETKWNDVILSRGRVNFELRDNGYYAELQTYYKEGAKAYQPCLLGCTEAPMIRQAGEWKEMRHLIDSRSGVDCYLDAGELRGRGKNKFMQVSSWNTAGRMHIRHCGENYFIDVNPVLLSEDEYAEMVNDFASSLIDLILDDRSTVHAKQNRSGSAGINAIPQLDDLKTMTDSLCAIQGEPIRILDSRTDQIAKRDARVDADWIKAHLKSPFARTFRGRKKVESFDTPENRFVHYAADRVQRFLRPLPELLDAREASAKYTLDNAIRAMQRDTKRERTVATNVRSSLKKKRAAKMESFKSASDNWIMPERLPPPEKLKRAKTCIHIKSQHNSSGMGKDDFRFDLAVQGDSFYSQDQLVFACRSPILSLLGSDNEIEIDFTYTVVESGIGALERTRTVYKVHSIVLLRTEYDRQIEELAKRTSDSQVDGRRPDPYEKFVQAQEEKQKTILQNRADRIRSYVEEMKPGFVSYGRMLRSHVTRFRDQRIKMSPKQTLSMAFIGRKSYRNFYKAYQRILRTSAKEMAYLYQVLEVIEFPIVELPFLYERWCLLAIFKVLCDRYGYRPEPEYREKLIAIGSGRRPDEVSFIFTRDDEAALELTYQKRLRSDMGLREPDFFLEFEGVHKDSGDGFQYESRADMCGMIMDAKYKDFTFDKAPHLHSHIFDTYDLYRRKNYGMDGQYAVFILHPSPEVNPEPTTRQLWADHCFYGGYECEVEKDDDVVADHPKHRYGFVQVRPAGGELRQLDNLQRVIGLYLQYGVERNEAAGRAKLSETLFCLVCGSLNVTHDPEVKAYSGVAYRCEDCEHPFQVSYCWQCQQRLWKHGKYWTYHDMSPTMEYDIRCPNCYQFLRNRK